MKSKVTIGVCTRNCESTILKTVESIVAQDYPHELLEVLVVDGCSSDKTVQIVKEVLSNSDIKGHIFFENKGLGFARQIVVDNAQGKYIVWVDGDMILPKDFVKKQVEFMEKNPKVGIAKGRYNVIKENSLVAFLEDIEFMISTRDEKVITSGSLGTSGCIYRVKAIRQVRGFDQNIKGAGEDTDAEYRVKTAGWKICISSAHFYESRRRNWQELWREYFWLGKGAYQFFRKNKKIIDGYKMFPWVLLVAKIIQTAHAYKFTRKKVVFLLPLHYAFKRIAWFFGFLRAHIDI